VARLGDFDLNDPTDDKYVQEFEIVNSIFHQSLALLQLNASIVPHPTVIPACLWTDDEFKFEALKRGTWSIEELEMKSVAETSVECEEKAESKFCTNHTLQPDELGRTSEVHLYAQHKLIPFLLGMALTEQSEYTKLASHISWIEQTVGESFEPMDCALRHIEHRQYDPESFIKKNFSYSHRKSNETSAFVGIVPRTFVVTTSPKNHKVRIVDDLSEDGLECSGSVIEKDFVLTTASCVKLFP
jgi:transmembrane protease serine 9